MRDFGVVVIGRNEAPRLRECLDSALASTAKVVYVDSGSADGSPELARSIGVEAINLDMSRPFTAGRARNEGFARLLEQWPDLEYVQFVDADCKLDADWFTKAIDVLEGDDRLTVVCGRRRERRPDASVYNRLCDLEWDTPKGDAKTCGGDAMMRVAPLQQVKGFDPSIIAGEEPDLCIRLRAKGWKVYRLDAQMTLHDAAMTRFSQWWLRAVRGGHAYAEGAWLHGRRAEHHCVRSVTSIFAWAVLLPILAVVAVIGAKAWGLLLLMVYPLQWWRVSRRKRLIGYAPSLARWFALFIMLGKFAGAVGMMRFAWIRLWGRPSTVIEYKGPDLSAVAGPAPDHISS